MPPANAPRIERIKETILKAFVSFCVLSGNSFLTCFLMDKAMIAAMNTAKQRATISILTTMKAFI